MEVSVNELDLRLKDLLKWERFALQLPSITISDIYKIKKDNSNDIEKQKIALFYKWLQKCVDPSWEAVIKALELIDHITIAKHVRDSITITTDGSSMDDGPPADDLPPHNPSPDDLPHDDLPPDDPPPDDQPPDDLPPENSSPDDPDDLPPDALPPDAPSSNDSNFIEAIAEGGGYLKQVVVIMHGPPGAGKTSVKQLFLDRPPLDTTEQNSTDILERPIRTYTVKSGGIDRLCEMKKGEFQQILLSSIQDKANDHRSETNQLHGSDNTSYIPFVNPPSTSLVHLKEPRLERTSQVKSIMKKMSSTAKCDFFNLDWIYLVDSGGQPQFLDVLPLLFRSEALYIVVIRLDQDLDVKQNNCYCLNGEKYNLPEKLNLTNLEMIEKTCQIAEAQSSETSPKQVMVIATHIDKVTNPMEREERVKEFDIQLSKLQTKYEKILVTKDMNSGKIMFPVNAMATGTERQVYTSELQQCLIKIAKKSIKPFIVPLKWFVYELDLDEESNDTHCVKKSKCVELGTVLGMTPLETENCLIFFNKLALLIYHPDFPDTVLINIDPFVKRLSALIRISFILPQGETMEQYNKLKQCGLFKKSLLSSAFESFLDNDAISVDAFLHISECLKVIVHVIKDVYFIPSVLPVDCNQDCVKYKLIPFVLNWGDHIVLPCFFSTLIVMLLRQKDNFTLLYNTKQNISQARNRIILNVELYGGVLTLTNDIKWIGVYYSSDSIEYYIKILKKVCEALREVVKYLKNCMLGTQYPSLSFVCQCQCTPECHPCKLTIDSKNCICSSDQSNVYPVTDNMKKIIESVVPLFNNDTDDQGTSSTAKRAREPIDNEGLILPNSKIDHLETQNHLSYPSVDIDLLVDTVHNVFRRNFITLVSLLQDCIEEFAREMFLEQLIPHNHREMYYLDWLEQLITHHRHHYGMFDRRYNLEQMLYFFLDSMNVMTEQGQIERHCSKFLKVLHTIEGQNLSEYMKEQLVDDIKTRLNIDLHLDYDH